MTTFATEDRKLARLLAKTLQPQNDPQANAGDKNTEGGPSKAFACYGFNQSLCCHAAFMIYD